MRIHPVAASEGSEPWVSGPLRLSSREPDSLTWLIRVGPCVVGWAKMRHLPHHVGALHKLYLSHSVRNPFAVATRLLSAIFEYARDHGLLKLKVQSDCAQQHAWLRPAFASTGFSCSDDQQTRPDKPLQVYVDLYRNPRSHPRPRSRGHVHPAWAENPGTETVGMAFFEYARCS